MKVIQSFKSKSRKNIDIIAPSMDWLDEILRWANVLSREDTFLTFDPGKEILREDEEKWLEHRVTVQEKGRGFLFWAIYDNHIIGSVDINRGSNVRDWHVGTIGLMVDKDFRGEGIGKYLLDFILKKGREAGIRTAVLDCFSDNETALELYKKMGFVEFGRLPDGLYRKNHFSDRVYMYQRLL